MIICCLYWSGGGTPVPRRECPSPRHWGTPVPGVGTPVPARGCGTPEQGKIGYPSARTGQGYPLARTGLGYPLHPDRTGLGYPLHPDRTGLRYPHPNQDRTWVPPGQVRPGQVMPCNYVITHAKFEYAIVLLCYGVLLQHLLRS